MKHSLLLIPTLLLFISCSPKDNPVTGTSPAVDAKTISTAGPVGYISVYLGAESDDTLERPAALTFSFTPSSNTEGDLKNDSDHFSLKSIPEIYFEQALVKDQTVLSFGCDRLSAEVPLPEIIEADQVSICGKVSFLGVQLKIKSNHLRLDNVEIRIESNDDQQKGILDLVQVSANVLELIGSNSLTAKSTFDNERFSAAPPIVYTFGKISGSGVLQTISQSHVYTKKVN